MARIASRQHGVATRGELLDAGVTVAEIKHRLRTGALISEHPGVYRVGHRAPSVEARYLAAVRACGEGAVLSGRAAAHLLGLVKGAPPPPEVTAPRERRIPGVITRRSRRMDARDQTTWRAVPVTTVPRTLVDLAAVLSLDDLARACHEAGIHHHATPARVEAVLAAGRTRPARPSCGPSFAATPMSRSASSRPASWISWGTRSSSFPRPTAPPAGAAWIAAGPPSA